MDKKVIAVLFGGVSGEHEVSKLSAANIIAAMDEDKYFILPIYITKDGRWFLYDGAKENIKNLQWEKFATPVVLSPDAAHRGILRLVGDKFRILHVDVVFPVLHGRNGEDGTIQGLLELARIPYVGSGVAASAICMDKIHTNMLAEKIGLKQARYLVFDKKDLDNNIDEIAKKIRYELKYPCFVKPASTGSSVGISKARNKKELALALAEAAKHDDSIIVEQMMAGREIECAVLGNETSQASGVGEITYETEFYCYDAKYTSNTSRTIVPANLPTHVVEQIREQSLAIYRTAGCRGLARVDFFVNDEDVIFNEINTMPGFTNISMFPMLWREAGMTDAQLVDKLIELATEQQNEQ
ncbi:MAG: D-alanine--D-alanine ligase [Defluviitaleaceae bacterium]|nr:D-alanine--D-alanine ligase [Defluviitaleaceae bacterium]